MNPETIYQIFIVFILAALAGILDRVRGSDESSIIRFVSTFVVGVIIAYYCLGTELDWKIMSASGLLWIAGERPGWGFPMGNFLYDDYPPTGTPEKWQNWSNFLIENSLVSLVLRGFMWGIPLLLLIPWGGIGFLAPAFAMAAAFPLACIVGRNLKSKNRWRAAEVLRGILMVLIVVELEFILGVI